MYDYCVIDTETEEIMFTGTYHECEAYCWYNDDYGCYEIVEFIDG